MKNLKGNKLIYIILTNDQREKNFKGESLTHKHTDHVIWNRAVNHEAE